MEQAPLQQLTDKIYASNPELKQLGVGCEVLRNGNVETIDGTYLSIVDNCDSLFKVYYGRILFDEYDIIGKPPTLVDVLEWLRTFNAFDVYMNIEADFYNSKKDKYASWNLNSIYLRDQDEALISFLNNL